MKRLILDMLILAFMCFIFFHIGQVHAYKKIDFNIERTFELVDRSHVQVKRAARLSKELLESGRCQRKK